MIGAVLDRNGLRPGRYWVTDDGLVVLASEVGVLDIDPAAVVPQGPAAAGPDVPGRHRRRAGSSSDEEIKAELAAEHPYDEWLHAGLVHLDDLPPRARARCPATADAGHPASRCSATPRRS